MADNSYRIRVKVGEDEDVVRVNLKQGIKTLNILSLEINPEDEYDIQTADYGVIVGRVLANDAYGIPNVKVSVFIPIDEADKSNYIISNEYPYRTPQSYDINGVKYNLIEKKENSPGTFPSKRMVLDNDGMVEVFDKYWKYTTTTNQSGDYMIFGVPTGTCQVHYDCDLSDIGILSQHPYDFVARGYDKNLFKSMTEFNTTNLASAVHIKSQDKSVYVYPFWGNKERNQIGITRNDIKIDYEFRPSCVFMGSSITDSQGSYISTNGEPNGANGRFSSLVTSTGDIEIIRKTQDGRVEELKDNVKGIIDGNGVWCYMIPMNLDRIGTDEFGNKIAINDPNKGIPTRARVRFRISLSTNNNPSAGVTAKMLVPCNPEFDYQGQDKTGTLPIVKGYIYHYVDGQLKVDNIPEDYNNIYEFGSKTPDSSFRDLYWGKVYSVKQYYPRFHYDYDYKITKPYIGDVTGFEDKYSNNIESDDNKVRMYDYSGYPPNFAFKQSCISSIDVINGMNAFPYNTLYAGPEASIDYRIPYWFYYHMTDAGGDESLTSKGLHFCFENDWINGCLYFPRVSIIGGEYFGQENNGDDKWFDHTYISGRHYYNWDFTEKRFKLFENWMFPSDDQDNYQVSDAKNTYDQSLLSVFTRARLSFGILSKKNTMLGESVFYYRCGGITEFDAPFWNEEIVPQNLGNRIGYIRLYSTDIILLGNLDDLYDHIPKLYTSLQETTTTFPPVAPPKELYESGMSKQGYKEQIETSEAEKDRDTIDIFGNYDNINDEENHLGYKGVYGEELYKIVHKIHEGNEFNMSLFALARRYSLFFGLRIWELHDFLCYDIPSFINLSRICELDVHNDRAFKVGPVNIIPTNGMIDVYDIERNDNRSLFATLNHDINKYKINNLGHREFVSTPLVINGFDGRLDDYIKNGNSPFELIMQDFSTAYTKCFASDFIDDSYVLFRYGYKKGLPGPFMLPNMRHIAATDASKDWVEAANYNNGNLPLTQNSFYFYFGLRSGFSALDALNENFIGEDSYKKGYGSSSNVSYVNIEQLKEKIYCKDGEIVGDCLIQIDGLSFPVTYEIYRGVYLVKNGETSTSNMIIRELPIGSYTLKITDAKENKLEKTFSLLKYGPTADFSKGYDRTNDMPFLTIQSINNYEIKGVSGYSGTTLVKLIPETMYDSDNINGSKIQIGYSLPDGVSSNDVILSLGFSPSFKKIISIENQGTFPPTMYFLDGTNSVDVMLSGLTMTYGTSAFDVDTYDQTCINTQYNINLVNSFNLSLQLNDVPVKYIAGWTEYIDSEIEQCEPDSIIDYSNREYNIFDSVNVLHPARTSRWFNFDDNVEYGKQLKYVSKMFSYICGENNMKLSNNGDTGNIVLATLSPNISIGDGVYDYYTTPYKNWDSEKLISNGLQQTKIDGVSYGSKSIPHIVGSNYPRHYYPTTFLKEGANGSNDFDWFQYLSNKSFSGGTRTNNTFYFGTYFFGCRDSQNSELDEPGSPITPAISSETLGTYELSDIKGMLAIRTVDKRFDYQFNIRTPLLLPSGYDLFTSLSGKSIYSGYAWLQLYGGIRLDYDNETKQLTSYRNYNGHISEGPTSGASLWGESIYESDSDSSKYTPTFELKKNNIWGISPQNNDDVFDIDNVEYKFSNLGNKSSFFNAEFKGCSSDFGDGYVKEGDSVNFKVSYDSPIEIIREGDNKFNLGYYIEIGSGVTSTSGTVSASLSGASLTLKIKPDNNWDGLTYTDVIGGGTNFDDGNYPYWALQSGVCISSTSCTNSGCKRLLFGLYDSYNLSQNGDEILVGDEMTTFNFIGNAANIKIPDVTESNYHFVSAYYDNGNDFQPIDDKSLQDKGTFYFSGETSNITSDFLLIPSRKIYANTKYGTSLKQGVVFNLGYAYYSGPITYDYSCINDSVEIKIRLKTPLRGGDDTINYETHYLSGHTIGKVENCYLKTTDEDDADVTYDESKCEFTITGDKTISKYRLYFNIVNGFRYKIIIDNSGNSGGGGTANIGPIPKPVIHDLTPITQVHPSHPGADDIISQGENENQLNP